MWNSFRCHHEEKENENEVYKADWEKVILIKGDHMKELNVQEILMTVPW